MVDIAASCSKGNRKQEKGEARKSIHPVASASTSVLNPQAREEHSPSCIPIEARQGSAFYLFSSSESQVTAGWRTPTVMMMSDRLNVGLWQLK